MKKLLLAAVLVGASSPLAAQKVSSAHPTPADAVRLLANPAAQDLIAQKIASIAGIILDTKVGPVATLTDPRDHIRPEDTLRSVEQRRDPELDRHLYEGSRRAVATAGAVAGGAAIEAAELRRTADRLRAALGPLVDAAKALNSGQ
ncbi:hypothetical protein [Sphingomonas bacterium]|uniref:hypothetical protein n=1 Tax=Sphingomonas bacterium TaxID=1895847 RepID=UPI001575BDBB|nr:hypothetical protein [Sphingomonas bacterium]